MKAAGSSLIAALAAGGPYLIADLYTFELLNGSTYYWTPCEISLTVGGHTYLGSADASVPALNRPPVIKRTGSIRTEAGTSVSTMDLLLEVGSFGSPPLVAGNPIPLAALRGVFDGATFKMDRIFMGPGGWGDVSLGAMPWFYGQVADVEPTSTTVKLTIKSGLEALNVLQIPRRVFQHLCPYALYSPACGATKSPVSAMVVSGSGAPSVVVNDGSATGHWNGGTVTFADGQVREIVTSTLGGGNNTLVLAASLAAAPSGSVSLLLGCDKQLSTCDGTFGRSGSFGGLPFLAPPAMSKPT